MERETHVARKLLDGLPAAARAEIIAGGRSRSLSAGQVLFRTGEPAERLFVLRRGLVRFGRLTHSGSEVLMGILVPGDVFGLGTLIAGPISCIGTAEVTKAGEALVWTHRAAARLAMAYPQLAINTLRVALHYVTIFADRHLELVSGTAEQRLARSLTNLAFRIGTHTPDGVDVEVKNDQLASLADTGVFTVSRLLKQWEREGAIEKRRGSVRIVRPERLIRG